MKLTKKEKAIMIYALKERIFLAQKDLNAYYYDLNHDQTALTENVIKLLTMFNRKEYINLEKEYEHKIKSIERIKKQILEIEKIILKLEATDIKKGGNCGIKFGR